MPGLCPATEEGPLKHPSANFKEGPKQTTKFVILSGLPSLPLPEISDGDNIKIMFSAFELNGYCNHWNTPNFLLMIRRKQHSFCCG